VAPPIFDVEQAVLLLELDPPFGKREVQLARRKLAKIWHPDIAPPGKQFEHERHLKVINEAADTLERLAEQSRGGRVTKNAVKVSASAARKAREEAGRRAWEEEQRQRESAADQEKHDPFGTRLPDHSVVHKYARCLSYPEWGVGTVNGIYFTGDPEDSMQQWARVSFHIGIRTVPAGSLQFVDFSTPDPGAERVQRFMTAAKHALADGDFLVAAKRLVFARDAEPTNAQVLRLMTTAFWQAGDYAAAARSVRDWARLEPDRPAPHRTAARIYEDMGSLTQAMDAARRETEVAPNDAPAWERLGRLRMRRFDRDGAFDALDRARTLRPSEEGLLDLALVAHLQGDLGTEVSACEQATRIAPESPGAWARYAHALARTDRTTECLAACDRALQLSDDPEVRALAEQVRGMAPREIAA
jgi:tetratricopeptide (TPR) repeat protein